MATSLREGHSRQSSHLSQGEREAHSHPASLLSERDGSLLLPHSRQSSILSALSDSFSSSYYSHSLSSHSRQTSLLSSHRSSPSSHSRVSSLLSDSTSPFPSSSFYPSQAQSSPHGLPSYPASPSQPHRLQQNGNHCRQPSASSSHSRSSPPLSCNEDMLHACVFHQFHQSFQKPFVPFLSMSGRVTTTLATATLRRCDQDTRASLHYPQTLMDLELVTIRAKHLVMAMFPSLVPIADRAAMTGNI